MQAGVTALGSFGVGGAFIVDLAHSLASTFLPLRQHYSSKEHKDAATMAELMTESATTIIGY